MLAVNDTYAFNVALIGRNLVVSIAKLWCTESIAAGVFGILSAKISAKCLLPRTFRGFVAVKFCDVINAHPLRYKHLAPSIWVPVLSLRVNYY